MLSFKAVDSTRWLLSVDMNTAQNNMHALHERQNKVSPTINVKLTGDYLTIRLRARVFYEQIVNEAQPS